MATGGLAEAGKEGFDTHGVDAAFENAVQESVDLVLDELLQRDHRRHVAVQASRRLSTIHFLLLLLPRGEVHREEVSREV